MEACHAFALSKENIKFALNMKKTLPDADSLKSSSTYSRILKYTGLFGGVQILGVLISVVRNKVAAVLIGTAGMGLTDILNRTTDMFGSMTNMGISLSGVRKLSSDYATDNMERVKQSVSTIRLWSLIAGVFGMTLCAAFSGFVSNTVFGGVLSPESVAIVSPIVFFMTLYGGETAILKGTRNLRRLAYVTVAGAVASLIITTVLYIAAGMAGVPWALLAGSAVLLALTLRVTNRLFPWSQGIFAKRFLTAGKPMLALGLSYVAAGFAGTGAEMLVRAAITHTHGNMNDVGIYAAGFVLCVTYTRLVFVAMDADYFPRISAISENTSERNAAMSKQIDVCVLLMAPMLVAFLMLLPIAVKLLYTSAFIPAVAMCIGATGYLFIKAIVAPMEYIPLAKGDSMTYFVMELLYDIVFVVLLIAGYRSFGLAGAGWALTASYAVDIIAVGIVYRMKYNCRFKGSTLKIIIVQGITVSIAVAVFMSGYSIAQYVAGSVLMLISSLYSIRKLNLSWNRIRQAIRSRMHTK